MLEVFQVLRRRSLVADFESGLFSVTELAAKYGIARQRIYKWVDRYEEGGLTALLDRPPIARVAPHRTVEEVEFAILWARELKPTWGAKKLLELLRRARLPFELCARSTADALLARYGLVRRRHPQRRKLVAHDLPLRTALAPNDLWCIDFKGDFLMRNGQRCYPLTITDAFSRYILEIRAMPSTNLRATQRVFEDTFKRFGLPQALRSDNGEPFCAARAPGGLSSLSAWFIQLGIDIERIAPGKPQQNGRHERMHGTMVRTPGLCGGTNAFASQQRALDAFRLEFNDERPHEALHMATPSEIYAPSTRRFPKRLPAIEYPKDAEVRLVAGNGSIRFNGGPHPRVFISAALAGRSVALRRCDPGWIVHFGPIPLGIYDGLSATLLRFDEVPARHAKAA